MKITKAFIVLSFLVTIISACGTEQKESTNAEETVEQSLDLEGLEAYQLDNYLIPGSIYLPNNMGKPEFTETDWGSLVITIGDRFGLEITPSGLSIAEKKAELEGDLVYQISYEEENEESILYTKTIADADVKPEHHFYRVVEIDGELISIQSAPDMSFSAGSIKNIVRSIKSYQ